MTEPDVDDFLGDWTLDTDSCEFDQGEPPSSASISMSRAAPELVIAMNWIDAQGESQHVSFRANPNGENIPFNGGPLADALSLAETNGTTLVATAYRDGRALMITTWNLIGGRSTMEVEQKVHLPDGTSPTNCSTYHRRQ